MAWALAAFLFPGKTEDLKFSLARVGKKEWKVDKLLINYFFQIWTEKLIEHLWENNYVFNFLGAFCFRNKYAEI